MGMNEETIERNFRAIQGYSQETRELQRESEDKVANMQKQITNLTGAVSALQNQVGLLLATRGTGATT